jgi:pyruvate-formate lyase-activating enzyme
LPNLPERLAKTLPYFLRDWQVDGERIKGCCIVGSQGDALLYPLLPKLLKDLHFAGIEVGLVTNGYGFTDKLIQYAAAYCKFIGFSMDAGKEDSYEEIKHTPKGAWKKVTKAVGKLCGTIESMGLRNDVGWKILILPDTYTDIYESCRVAKDLGCRYVQIRPADLPEKYSKLIDKDTVEEQIIRAIAVFEEQGIFEIVGVRHKFTEQFKPVLPNYCYMTPLTVTITSDGKAYACVDRRCDEATLLADCGRYGWVALKEIWGSTKHVDIVHSVINRNGEGPDCGIRCSNYGYDKFFLNYFVEDNVDRNMI